MADPQEKGPWEDYAKPAQESGPWEDYAQPTTHKATMEEAQRPINTLPPGQAEAMQSQSAATMYGLQQAGKGAWQAAKGIAQTFDPRIKPEEAKYAAMGPGGLLGYRMATGLGNLYEQAKQVPGAIRDLSQSDDPWFHIGMQAPGAAGEAAAQLATYGAAKAIPKLARIGEPLEPNAAITEGLHVPAKSPKMRQAVTDVEGARPYLEGVKSQAELQQRLPGVKQQVWEPYQKAVDSIKNRPVQGPDGPTTVGELEAERLKVSAERQAIKKIRPTDQQSAVQAQKAQADLNARYKAITDSLDPEIRSTGVDPRAIREVHGNLKGVERNVSGKSTVTERLQPYGLRKMVPHGVPKILGGEGTQWSPIEGLRDIRSGESGMLKPTDVGVKRIFAPKK